MIHSARELPDGRMLDADVCIVGAGAAGIAIALNLIGSGLDVLLLESGGEVEDPQTQSLYEGVVADERMHSPPDRYRQRRFGGSTTIWGGRCMPLDPIDYAERPFVPNSGWPIGPEALAPFYPQANRLCEAGEFAYTAASAFARPPRPMIAGYSGTDFTSDTLERFSCPTNFAARYRHKLAAASDVRLLLHANVTELKHDSSGRRIEALDVRVLNGPRLMVRARRVVLAAGGLEVARLMLASRDERHPRGVGNEHDVVGRYYMCHLAGTIGTLKFDGPLQAIHNGYDVSDEGIYCRQRLALTEPAQRRRRLGNFVARLHHPRLTDPAHRNAVLSLLYLAKPLIPYEYAKRLHGPDKVTAGQWLRHVGNVIRHPLDALGFAWHMLRDRKLAERKFPSIIIRSRANLFSLDFHAEQEPNPDSRVSLTDELDALQMPRLLVDWRYTPGDVATVTGALELLARDIERSGVGRFDYDASTVEFEMTRYGAYGGHHIGTARMGADPHTSVVDADCKVHGLDNLFVASAAVFPTSSQANPTLTVVALALRLAAHLRADGAASAAGSTASVSEPAAMAAGA